VCCTAVPDRRTHTHTLALAAEAIFDVDYFARKPDAFYYLCRELWPGKHSPTPAHHFIRLLSDRGLLQRCYTQVYLSLPVGGYFSERVTRPASVF
jgi:NAD-dependent SIR2 family protein deacetylase